MSKKILNQAEIDLANRRLQAEIQAGHENTRQILAWRHGAMASAQAVQAAQAAEEARMRRRRRNLLAPFSLLLIIALTWGYYSLS